MQSRDRIQEKLDVLRGIWLLGTTFRRGLSKHQADTAQVHVVETNIVVPTPPRSTSLSLRLGGGAVEPGLQGRLVDGRRGRLRSLASTPNPQIKIAI